MLIVVDAEKLTSPPDSVTPDPATDVGVMRSMPPPVTDVAPDMLTAPPLIVTGPAKVDVPVNDGEAVGAMFA
jgi:hypothetical protein